jgi:hypothetical protein
MPDWRTPIFPRPFLDFTESSVVAKERVYNVSGPRKANVTIKGSILGLWGLILDTIIEVGPTAPYYQPSYETLIKRWDLHTLMKSILPERLVRKLSTTLW